MTEKYRKLQTFVEGAEGRLLEMATKRTDLQGLIAEKFYDYERAIMRNEDTKEIVEVIKNLESDLENTRNEIEVIRKIDTKAHIRQEQAPLINEIIKNNTNEIERLQVAHDNKEQEVKQAKIDFLTKVRELGEIKQRADELAKENTNSHEYARQENEPQKVFSSVKTNINELNKRGCIYISAEESEHHYTRKEPISAKLKRL